jgi:hypothetical protein
MTFADLASLGLDHFRAYDLDGVTVDYTVALEGQFDKGFRKHRLVSLDHFANPADKNGEGILDKHSHQTWYALDPLGASEPTRTVSIVNQFGAQKIVTGDAAVLIVPAEKIEEGSAYPKSADHYKCYRVEGGEEYGKKVTLRDQFRRDTVGVLEPLLFGVPVAKRRKVVEPIHNEKAHLTIYRLEPRDNSVARKVRDQFEAYRLRILATALLAVPTLKVEWEE